MSEKLEVKLVNGEMQISDGYHTFEELYEHRVLLWIKSLFRQELSINLWINILTK